ncbi:MAG TPA: arylamine N-acetyltransferase [Albitalea sp.]|nr:arylamine N-acetyltransferase [Albitalea sp.]
MAHRIDLTAYLRRIGFMGAARADLECLRGLVGCHVATIPFENLNPLLGLPVDLEPAAIEEKLVRHGRGGYCFEHNLLFAEVLLELGFDVTALAARVVWNQPSDAITARSHMLLRVDIDRKPWLVDVGFGGLTLTGAVQLAADIEQATPHEVFRLVEVDGDWRMQARLRGEWKTLYCFDLQRQHPIDFQAANYYLSTHPSSRFVRNLIAARAAPGRRLALLNAEFAVHSLDGDTQRRALRSDDEITEVLEREFLLTLPAHPELAARLAALTQLQRAHQ